MTPERADEIMRKVIYARLTNLPKLKDSEDAFHVGRLIGQIQRQLEIELLSEVESQKNEDEVTSESVIYDAVSKGAPLPENLTNGDVIKALFPNIQIYNSKTIESIYTGIPFGKYIGANVDCMREWWEAPYERNVQNEKA